MDTYTCKISERHNFLLLVDGKGHIFEKVDHCQGIIKANDHMGTKVSTVDGINPRS